MKKNALVIVLAFVLCACTKKDTPLAPLPDTSAVRANLAFTCVHEADRLPALDPEADKLFKYARYLEKKDGPKDFNNVSRYYRIAAAHGHYKANRNLQLLIAQGLADSPDAPKESVDLAMQLVIEGVPSGYYDIGHYLETGYGLKPDIEAALSYFRKAADLGNPEAQAYVAEQLAPHDRAPDIAKQMRQCAADQGYGDAANSLAINLKNSGLYPEAVVAYQKGVEAGDILSAMALGDGFTAPPSSDRLTYLALPSDPERARRYREIEHFIRSNDGNNPKIPDIDKIVPLPPAQLPPWDGNFLWQKQRDAAALPVKPSDELVEQMAKAKALDPVTGLPLKGLPENTPAIDQSAAVTPRVPIGTIAATGEVCPEDGQWCARLGKGQTGDSQRRFLKGDVLPSLVVHESRKLALLDKLMEPRQQMSKVEWELVGYLDHQA
ncbi:sel1 repeat family protein [Paraburkholderia sp. D15]|uniref:SEL1-like repeat protein n=1 Tax=Paraburkholderia sp. D15 TaxID=2880218 RepID=UPI002478BC30|nr:sel1 repeat family protein [Paraburkholderia sp. D15]WGS51346.1 sel1 repeat family protein [Paraburkholderia sp. D15]